MTFVFLDERWDSINDGFFVTQMDGYPNPPQLCRGLSWQLPQTTLWIRFAGWPFEIHKWKIHAQPPLTNMALA